jgi:hypothetical protein
MIHYSVTHPLGRDDLSEEIAMGVEYGNNTFDPDTSHERCLLHECLEGC